MVESTSHSYEIHITVKAPDVELFKQVCVNMGVKPIIIDMVNRTGDHLFDVMTSYTVDCQQYPLAWVIMAQQVLELKQQFTVVRCKMETVPWHHLAPSSSNGLSFDGGQHFETHFGLMVHDDRDDAELRMFADEFKLHMSSNVFKRYADGSHCQMITARSYTMRAEEFQEYSDALRDALQLRGFKFRKPPRVEFAIWDSNKNHDYAWLN